MRLYLVQHGEAVDKAENPDRPLTDKGRQDINRIAVFLARGRVHVERVIHSGKTRAVETAVLLSQVVGPGGVVEEGVGLAPKDPAVRLLEAAADWHQDTMVVGHLPFLGKAVSAFVAGDEDTPMVAFKPGTVACLERDEDSGTWTLQWFLRPELLGQ